MAILYLLLLVQIYFLCNVNLTQLEYFLGYDASAVYLQALMIEEQGTLMIQDWIYTSTLTWDTPMLLAVEFLAWFDDIYVAFGLSILLSLALLCWIGLGLLQQVGASHKAKVLFFICLLTPYVTYQDAYNRIDYYGVILSIFGVYTLKTALMMALWWMFFYLDRPELRPHPSIAVKIKRKTKGSSGQDTGNAEEKSHAKPKEKTKEKPVKEKKPPPKNKAGEIIVPVKPPIKEVVDTGEESKLKEEKSSENDENSSDKDEKSSENEEKDSEKEDKSSNKEEKPSDNEEKDSEKEEKGSEKEDKSSNKEDKPSENEDKPSENDEKGSDKEEKPSDKEDKPSEKEEKDSDKEDKPSEKKDKSSEKEEKDSDKEDKSSEKEKKTSEKEEKNSTKGKQTSSAQKTTGEAVKSQVATAKKSPQQEKTKETVAKTTAKTPEPEAEEVIVLLKEHPKTYIYILALLMSVFITAMSSGYHVLLYGILPPLVYSIFRNCRRDKWEPANIRALVFLVVCVGLSLWGKSIQTEILGMVGHDSTLGWTTIADFWTNLLSIFQGYLQLTGALPVLTSPNLFSEEGFFFVCFLILSLGYLWAGLAKMPFQKRKQVDGPREYYTFLFCAMLVTFVFIYTTYGSPLFEVRYLIPNFIILLLFASLWLAEQLSGPNKSWRILLQLIIIPCLIVANLVSQDFIQASKINPTLSREVISYLADHESPVVYLAGEECIVFGQNIRVFDRNKTYIYSKTTEEFTHSGDYTYYLETAEYDGPVPLIMAQGDYEEMPDYFKSLFQKTHDFSAFLTLYECDYNALDYTAGITELEYSKDYPYTPGITLSDEGELIKGGRYLVDGAGSYVLWGPGTDAPSGVYDFTLHYEIVSARMMESEFLGVFDVTVDGGEVIASTLLDFEETSVTLEDVDLTEHLGLPYDYRVAVKGGTELEIIAVEMERKSKKSP